MKSSTSIVALLATSAFLGLAACSGGGGGSPSPTPTSSPTPTPTPTPTNSAPVAAISAPNGASADEGQPLILDASGSTDDDGDTLSFAWTQTSGPSAQIADDQTDMATVTLPEISADTVLTFEVEVSDGAASTTAAIDVTALDIVLTPSVDFFGERAAGVSGLENPRAVSFENISPFSGGPRRLSGVEDDGNGLSLFYFEKGTGETLGANEPSMLQGAAGDGVARAGVFDGSLVDEFVSVRARDEVNFYRYNGTSAPYELVASGTIVDPCAIAELQYSGNLAVGVGTGAGVQVGLFYFNGLDASFEQAIEITSSGSYCNLDTVDGGYKIYAVNSDDNSLHVWEVFANTASAVEYSSTDLSLPAGMVVTDIASFRLNSVSETQIAIVASDEEFDGDQRLMIFKERAGNTEAVAEFGWTKGIPLSISARYDSDVNAGELVLALEGVPYAAIVGIDGSAGAESFAFDGYAPLALGVSSISPLYGFLDSGVGYVVTYEQAGSIDILRIR